MFFKKIELIEEYNNRFIKRKSSEKFIDSFIRKWNKYVDIAIKIDNANKIVLNSKQFLLYVIDKI